MYAGQNTMAAAIVILGEARGNVCLLWSLAGFCQVLACCLEGARWEGVGGTPVPSVLLIRRLLLLLPPLLLLLLLRRRRHHNDYD